MKTGYLNILFDLDGTLTDSALGICKSVQYALKQYGIEAGLEEIKPFIGPPLHQSFINSYGFSEKEAFRAVEHYRDYYRETGIYENRLYPSVPEMLKALAGGGRKLFVATSKPTVFAEKIVRLFNLHRYFTIIAGSNLDGTRVEKSEVIGYVLDNIARPDRTETVMVGDRRHDIGGARALDIDSIAVTYGYGSLEELRKAGPDHIAHSVRELKELLLSLPQ